MPRMLFGFCISIIGIGGVVMAVGGCAKDAPDPPAPRPLSPSASSDAPPQQDATAGSAQPMEKTVPAEIAAMGEGWHWAPEAAYAARQTRGEVTLVATGESPTGGYKVTLVAAHVRIWPPQFLLARRAPDGPATQAITPFDSTARFSATERIATVRVRDGAGVHDVPVEQGVD